MDTPTVGQAPEHLSTPGLMDIDAEASGYAPSAAPLDTEANGYRHRANGYALSARHRSTSRRRGEWIRPSRPGNGALDAGANEKDTGLMDMPISARHRSISRHRG